MESEEWRVESGEWRVGKYASPQLCGIFEAGTGTDIHTPCSADAAHGVTEMRPLRGQDGKDNIHEFSVAPGRAALFTMRKRPLATRKAAG